MAAPNTRINDVAQEILDAVVAGLVSPPDRQFVADVEPAFDCELVAVAFNYLAQGLPGSEASRRSLSGAPRFASYVVWVARCVPGVQEGGEPPSVEQLEASALKLQKDAWLLPRSILTGDVLTSCDSKVIGRVSALPAQGYFSGNRMDLAVQL